MRVGGWEKKRELSIAKRNVVKNGKRFSANNRPLRHLASVCFCVRLADYHDQ